MTIQASVSAYLRLFRKRYPPTKIKTFGEARVAEIKKNAIMERDTGVEPVSSPWKGDVEPLN